MAIWSLSAVWFCALPAASAAAASLSPASFEIRFCQSTGVVAPAPVIVLGTPAGAPAALVVGAFGFVNDGAFGLVNGGAVSPTLYWLKLLSVISPEIGLYPAATAAVLAMSTDS